MRCCAAQLKVCVHNGPFALTKVFQWSDIFFEQFMKLWPIITGRSLDPLNAMWLHCDTAELDSFCLDFLVDVEVHKLGLQCHLSVVQYFVETIA